MYLLGSLFLFALVEITTRTCKRKKKETFAFKIQNKGDAQTEGSMLPKMMSYSGWVPSLSPLKLLYQGPSGQLSMLGRATQGARWMGSWRVL